MFKRHFAQILFIWLGLQPRPIKSDIFQRQGPEYAATAGEIWPKPLRQTETFSYRTVDPDNLEFEIVNENCDILEAAIERYKKIIQLQKQQLVKHQFDDMQLSIEEVIGAVARVRVNLTKPCEHAPHLDMDEFYYIYGDGRVLAHSIWGILRGLESLTHLLIPMIDGLLYLADTEIYDAPRFKYRGLMLDTARHFIGKPKILQLLEGMSYNKLNVFHWHVSDDSAFPYVSRTYPELGLKGAYHPSLTYTPADVAEIVEFARLRGIRVIPEFNTPSHTTSWSIAHPELLTQCGSPLHYQVGPLNPARASTFEFLHNFFSEIKSICIDNYVHIGADGVQPDCWAVTPEILRYLAANELALDDLLPFYLRKLAENLTSMDRKLMVWQEAVADHTDLAWPSGTIAQIRYDSKAALPALTARGIDVIMSDGWYLHVVETGSDDWYEIYLNDPHDFDGSEEQKRRVIGGEACLWTQLINEHNLLPTTFPRAAAVAERLWSDADSLDLEESTLRLEEHNCRMLLRGIETRPANGPGLC